MTALTDAEILAALPVESRQKINNSFEALSQSLPSPAEQATLYRVVHTLKLNQTDSVFSFVSALHLYLQLYQTIPDKIAKAGGEIRQAGAAVDAAIRKATRETLTEHAGALNAQAVLMAEQNQQALIRDVGKIAQKLAGDAAAIERYNARNKAVVFLGALMLVTAFIFSAGSYLLGKQVASSRLNVAEQDLAEANLQLETEKKRVDEKIVEFGKKSADEIEKIRAASGWAGTPTGRLAKQFFDLGGEFAATCKSETWDIVKTKEGKWCVPQRRDLVGSDSQKYGWKIP